MRVGEKVRVVVPGHPRAIISRIDGTAVLLHREIKGLRWWNISDLRPITYNHPKKTEAQLKKILLDKSVLTKEGCRVWTGAKTWSGYGKIRFQGRQLNAHRLAYMLFKGPIKCKEIVVCHSCDNPPCINPDHLWLGSQAENMKDARKKGRFKGGKK